MSDPLSLANVLSQSLEWLLERAIEAAIKSISAWRQNRGLARRLTDPEALLREVTPELVALREGPLADVPEAEWVSAVYAVRDGLRRLMPIQTRELYRVLRKADELADYVTERSSDLLAALGPDAVRAYAGGPIRR